MSNLYSEPVDNRLWVYTLTIYITGTLLAAGAGGLAALEAPVWMTAIPAVPVAVGGFALATVVFDRYE